MLEKQQFQLRVPIQNLHCYGCGRNFTSLEQFKSHHHGNNNERRKCPVNRENHDFGPTQVKNEKYQHSIVPIVHKCLQNQDEIKVTCDNCSIHFLSLQLFLTHLESPIQTHHIEYERSPLFDHESQNLIKTNENLDLSLIQHENINEDPDSDSSHETEFTVFKKSKKLPTRTKLIPEKESIEFLNCEDNGDEIDEQDDSYSKLTPSASPSTSPWQQIETDEEEEEEPGQIVNVCRRRYQRQYPNKKKNKIQDVQKEVQMELVDATNVDLDADDDDFMLEDSDKDDCDDSSDSDFEINYKPKSRSRPRKSPRGGKTKSKTQTQTVAIYEESNSNPKTNTSGEDDLDVFNEFDDGNSDEKKTKKNKKLACDLCINSKATYSTQYSLNKHKRRRHLPPTTAFVCPDCSYSFPTDYELGRHIARFTFEEPTACPVQNCEEVFKMKCKMKIHLREVHPRQKEKEKRLKVEKVKKIKNSDSNTNTNGEDDLDFISEFDDGNSDEKNPKKKRKLTCDLCTNSKATYSTQYSLNKHKRRRHLPPTTAFVCPDCSYSFPTDFELGRHLSRFTFEEPTTCLAQNCEEVFKMKCKMKIHLREVHPRRTEKEKRVKVEKVKRIKNSDSNTNTETNEDVDEDVDGELPVLKKQLCPIEGCNKMLVNNKKAIRRHLEIHNRDPNESHICDICGKSFHTKNYLKSHISTVHEKNLPFLCSLCGKKCSSKEKLIIHGRSHTGEKPFLCSACPLAFSTLSSLRRHAGIHSEQKQFKCPYIGCNKEFSMQQVLRRHLQIHSGLKPYKCLYCEMAFPDNRPLKKHVATQHPQAYAQQQMYESQQQQ